MMYDLVRARMAEAVPFAKHVGVELVEVADGRARAQLVQRPDLSNHIGTMHAGALFTLAETASGAAMTGAFIDMIGGLRPVAAAAEMTYLKSARGTVSCAAATVEPGDSLRARLREARKVMLQVVVDLFDENAQPVAKMTVEWNVRFASPD